METYGKRVKRNVNFQTTDGAESDRPQIMDWCDWRGYPCFHVTDATMDDWRAILLSLEEIIAKK